jgi:site-specific DNA-methyltransferase (adenine-specific)
VSHDREFGDSGGASRFFYVAKASRSERNAGLEGMEQDFRERDNGFSSSISDTKNPRGNIHPTVKPVALMKYLIRLVTPKGGVVLDPFLGSGTTAVAAIEEGVEWIGCEREPEYVEIIKARVAAAQPGMGLALEEER